MNEIGSKDHSSRPTKSRILAALYFLIDSSRDIGERELANDLNEVVCDHDDRAGMGDVENIKGASSPHWR